jgi:cell shape-determining protein MreC
MSEQALLLDRTRRAIEARMDELAFSLKELQGLEAEVDRLRASLGSNGRNL